MNVLQAPLRVVRGRHAQVLLQLGIPDARHVRDRERALDERALDLEAQDDVQRIAGERKEGAGR